MKNWVFIFLILAACDFAAYHDPAGQGENVDLGTPCADGGMEATLFFADIRAQILEPKCLSCHSAAGGNRGGVNLESFENTKAQLTRVKFTIENGLMPKAPVPPLSQDQKNIFASWLNQGAPKDQQSLQNCSAGSNGGGETPPVTDELNKMPSDEEINYALVNKYIFSRHCTACHSDAGGNSGRLNLETYFAVADEIGDVQEEISQNSMPPGPRPKLSSLEKQLLNRWIQLGLPN